MSTLIEVKRLAYEAGKADGISNALLDAIDALPADKRDAFMRANLARIKALAEKANETHKRLTRELSILEEILAWARGPATLAPCVTSAWHKVVAAKTKGLLWFGSKDYAPRRACAERIAFTVPPQIILLQHDWSSAFTGADQFDDGEVRQPFDCTAFEMMISGRRVIEVHHSGEDCVFIQAGDQWLYLGPPKTQTDDAETECSAIVGFLNGNVRAACIALDAEVAVTSLVRAPHKLNRAREKRGEPPVMDFHTVSLAKRAYRADASPGLGSHRSPRLHFRRGHWRHYENHKTWVRWTLVGNPDLGFIDKEYRL